jgi:hypothetical protein
MDASTQEWITPDPFSGDVRDPMSKSLTCGIVAIHLAYEDPTGFCSDPGGPGVRVCLDAFIQQSG